MGGVLRIEVTREQLRAIRERLAQGQLDFAAETPAGSLAAAVAEVMGLSREQLDRDPWVVVPPPGHASLGDLDKKSERVDPFVPRW